MHFLMRSLKIWGGGMAGLACGFLVALLLLQEAVLSNGTRVTTETGVSLLVEITVPLILGAALGGYLVALLTRPATGIPPFDSPYHHGPTDQGLSGRGEAFGEWTGLALLLGGVAVDDEAVWGVARLVKPPLTQKLETALRFRSTIVDVTPDDRKAILQALEDAPASLGGVRELLLTEESWRQSLTDLQQAADDGSPAVRSVA